MATTQTQSNPDLNHPLIDKLREMTADEGFFVYSVKIVCGK
jgi:hypothetical protein